MNRSLVIAALIGLVSIACQPSDVSLAPRSVRVDVRDPFGVRPPGPLNVALLWTTTSTIFATSQAMLPPGENTVDLPLEFFDAPPPGLFFGSFMLVVDSINVQVPRIAVFRDDDGSGRFTSWDLEDDLPPDRIFAVNGGGTTVAFRIQDLDADLARLTTPDVNRLYELTGGEYTDFLVFAGTTSTLTPAALTAGGPPLVSMYFDNSVVPARDIRCVTATPFSAEPSLSPISAISTSSRSVRIRVDETIDAESVCGLTTPDCLAVDLSTVTATVPDEVRFPGQRVFTQCRRSAVFESLVTLEAELQCDECNCSWVERLTSLVVRTSSTPPHWPCGQTVDFCPSPLPLFRFDEACVDYGDGDGDEDEGG